MCTFWKTSNYRISLGFVRKSVVHHYESAILRHLCLLRAGPRPQTLPRGLQSAKKLWLQSPRVAFLRHPAPDTGTPLVNQLEVIEDAGADFRLQLASTSRKARSS